VLPQWSLFASALSFGHLKVLKICKKQTDMYVFQNLDLTLHMQELFETLCKAKQTKAV